MMKLTLACGLALSLSLAACASTPKPAASLTGAPASSTATSTAQASTKPKLVCEEQKPLGSLIPQRICMTPEEAAARQKAAQDRIRQIQDQSAMGPGASTSGGG